MSNSNLNQNSKKRDQLQMKMAQTRSSAKANSEQNSKGIQNSMITRFEKFGYKFANTIHKYSVLGLVGFICFNIYIFGREYNAYWRARRVILIFFKI
jgi:hypothetical protein